MKITALLQNFFILGLCLPLLSHAGAQQSIELPEIKGSFSQVYQEVKIEITGIERMEEYQAHWPNSNRPRGSKVVAEPGHEIAVVRIHTERIGTSPGIRVSRLYLDDSEGKEYDSTVSTFFIGTGSESRFDPKEHDYEFPVMVPKGVRFLAVRLLREIHRDESPQYLIQKITFDVSLMGW